VNGGGRRPGPAEAKILLVDDLEENLVALSAVLKTLPATVVCARSGEDALRALMVDDFAVILLDVIMPEMDGFETAHHIKRKDRTRDIPIIFLTAASAEPDLAFRGYAAGAVDYLVKPFDPWALRSKVALLVELHELRGRVRAYSELLPGEAEPRHAARLVEQLGDRLAAVEAELTRLTADPAAKEHLLRLDDLLAHLRTIHTALFTRPS
jgi:CheY-like chemotaxis protein